MYWLRKRVPDELQERVGKKEERRSLKTKNPAEAKLRLSQALIELETKWANVKRGPVTLTEVRAHALAALSSIGGYKFTKTTPANSEIWNTELGVEGVWDETPRIASAHLIQDIEQKAPWLRERCFETADELLEKPDSASMT